jgi:hypothetical protein
MLGHMTTLHIEHSVTDYDTWAAAFGRFAPARQQAGVRAERIYRPADDDRYVAVDLDFDDAAAASAFLAFLSAHVWSTPANSPALDGTPSARILEPAAW